MSVISASPASRGPSSSGPSSSGPAPPLAWQASLFGSGEPGGGPSSPGSIRRFPLGHGAWLDHGSRWLTGADELFALLLARLHWSEREMPMYGQLVAQPRLSAWWSLADESVRCPVVARLAADLGRHYGVRFDSVGANLYRDGRDSVAFHGDRHARGPHDPDAVVAIMSLGSPRRLLLRPRGGGRSRAFTLAGGDLVVMGGSCQRTWQHAVPKMAGAGPRMSVTFRHPVA